MKENLEFHAVASTADLEKAAALADTIWHECYAQLLTPGQIDYMVESFQSAEAIGKQIANEGYHYFLLRDAGEDVGYLGVQPKDGKLLLSKIYILKEHRGQGYSPAIFAFAERLAAQYHCDAMWLTVNKGNDRAKAAYTKAGFSIIREQVVEIGGGFVMDDYVFEKCL